MTPFLPLSPLASTSAGIATWEKNPPSVSVGASGELSVVPLTNSRCSGVHPESAAEAEVGDDVVVVEDGVGVEVGVCAFAALVPAIAISITAVAAAADDRLSVSE